LEQISKLIFLIDVFFSSKQASSFMILASQKLIDGNQTFRMLHQFS